MKSILITLSSYLLCVLQSYISLRKFKNQPSSTCMNCNYLEEIVGYSLVVISILLIFILNDSYKKTKTFLIVTLFIICCLSVNFSIFTSRVTSWSTFTTIDELLSILKLSFFPLTIISMFFTFLLLKVIKL